jgi:hypothetical protein
LTSWTKYTKRIELEVYVHECQRQDESVDQGAFSYPVKQPDCPMPETRPGKHPCDAMSSQELQTIRGYIQALPKVHGREDAAKVAVVTDGGMEYRVLHKNAGMDLADYISADVEVQGFVSGASGAGAPEAASAAGGDGDVPPPFITVRSSTLVDGYDDDWSDDDA